MMTAQAALLRAVGAPFEFVEVEISDPRDHEVVVRMVATGLCHTDLSVRDGTTGFPLPAVLGHEGAGVVVATGSSVTSLEVGDHVVLQSASCGYCVMCLTGRPLHCRTWRELNLGTGRRADGSATVRLPGGEELAAHFFGQSSFSTVTVVDERTAVRVPKDVDLRMLGPLGCGIQSGAQTVLNVLAPQPGSHLAVFGAGAVGLSAVIAAASLTGTRVIAVDVQPGRLETARRLGAAWVCNAREEDPVAYIRDVTGGVGVENAIETSGSAAVLGQAVASLAPLGTCAVVGVPAAGVTLPLEILPFIANGSRLVGVNQGEVVAQQSIPALVELYRAGRFAFDQLVTMFPFADIESAASAALVGGVVKPVLVFE